MEDQLMFTAVMDNIINGFGYLITLLAALFVAVPVVAKYSEQKITRLDVRNFYIAGMFSVVLMAMIMFLAMLSGVSTGRGLVSYLPFLPFTEIQVQEFLISFLMVFAFSSFLLTLILLLSMLLPPEEVSDPPK